MCEVRIQTGEEGKDGKRFGWKNLEAIARVDIFPVPENTSEVGEERCCWVRRASTKIYVYGRSILI